MFFKNLFIVFLLIYNKAHEKHVDKTQVLGTMRCGYLISVLKLSGKRNLYLVLI
jgi:hypothetical protein